MYATLNNVTSEDAIHIIYYVIKLLNKSKNGPSMIIDIENIEADLNQKQEIIANKLLDEIDFKKLNNDIKIDKIIVELYEILKNKTNSKRKIDINNGKELLEKMKKDIDN